MAFNAIDPLTGDVVYGLTIQDSETILAELNTNVTTNIQKLAGIEETIDTSEQTLIGKLNQIFADRIASIWQTSKDVENSMYVESSTGVSLSKLAILVGFLRNPTTSSIGEIRVKGDDKTKVPRNTTYASLRGDEFENLSEFTISLDACLSFRVQTGLILASRTYSVTIDNNLYEITSDAILGNNTHYSILSQLQTVLPASVTSNLVDDPDTPNGEASYLEIIKTSQPLTMKSSVSSLLTPSFVEVEQQVQAVETGVVFGDADTIVEIITPVTGLVEVRNLEDFIIGSNVETDEELRERISTDFNSVGSGTFSTIEADLSKLEDVSSVVIDENRTFETNSNGVPPKSYEVILHHVGDDTSGIAPAIWDTKPDGIETHGDLTVPVKDAGGVDQDVSYTLAEQQFAHVRVKYTRLLNEAEVTPPALEDAIKTAVAEEGQSYIINQDVIGKRFYSPIFENISGLENLSIQVHLNSSALDPSTIAEIDWIPRETVDRTQIATFGFNRVLAQDVT